MFSDLLKKHRDFIFSRKSYSYEFRIQNLEKLKKIIIENQEAILLALNKDLKKSNVEAYTSEFAFSLEDIDNHIKNLKEWMSPRKVSTPLKLQPGTSSIYYEPYGVTLLIAPWNYPFQLVISPLIGAIAAGNSVIIKPSEISKNTERLLENLINTNFDEDYLRVIVGDKKTTQELLKERFDFIFFTGSTQVGKIVMKAASEHLTPVCLELGGKSPVVVEETADLEVSAKRIIWGKFFNAGQTCIAPDFVMLDEKIKTDFISLLKKSIRDFYGDNEKMSSDYGRIVSLNHYSRLVKLMNDGKILYGAHTDEKELFISPTLVEVENFQSLLMQEEIFGPILPILSFKNIQECLEELKRKEKPLAFYLFTKDEKIKNLFLENLNFGGATVNDTIMHIANPHLPFGGVGQSGIGSYHGKSSFEIFSHKKSILKKSFLMDLDVRYPPYNEKKISLLKKIF